MPADRRSVKSRRKRRSGGRRATDPRPAPIIAPAGAAIDDRVACLEGAVAAAWEAIDGHFVRARRMRDDLNRFDVRLQQLTDTLQVLTAATRRDHKN